MAELTQFPIAHPIREVLRELGSAAQRGIAYDAGRTLLSAATDPDLNGETIERHLNRADEEFEYRVRQCERDLPAIAESARNLRALSREVLGPSAREYDAILRDVRAVFPDYSTIRAAQQLGAEPVGGGRFAYRDATAGRWHTMDGAQLLHLRQIAAGYPGNIEDLAPWREYTLMPEWWSPERQSAWRIDSDARVRNELDFTLRFHDEGEAQYAADTAARDFSQRRDSIRVERVTANLTTGEEVVLQDEQNVNRRRLPETSVFGFAKEVLGAVEIAPGRFAFYDHRSEKHWSVGAAAIAEFDRALDDARRDVRECERYLALAPEDEKESAQLRADEARQKADPERVFWNWASTPGTNAVEMPSWWTTEQQEIIAYDDVRWRVVSESDTHLVLAPIDGTIAAGVTVPVAYVERITADPVTGREVVAAKTETVGVNEHRLPAGAQKDSLNRAIAYLNAVCIEEQDMGDGLIEPLRYAYRSEETHLYYSVTADALAELGFNLDLESNKALTRGQVHNLWRANTQQVEMPSWWTPQRQTAYRLDAPGVYEGPRYWTTYQQAVSHGGRDPKITLVTADPVTGKEKMVAKSAGREEIAMTSDDPNVFAEHIGKLVHLTFVEENALGSEFIDSDYRFIETEVGAHFNGGYRFVFEDEDGIRQYLFPFDIASYRFEEAEAVNRHASPTDALSRAIERLGAVEIAEGRYAFNADDYPRVPDGKAESRWMICSGERLTELASDPYNEEQFGNYWEDRTVIEPRWWTPQRQEAWRVPLETLGGYDYYYSYDDAVAQWGDEQGPIEHVTADLTTGEEVIVNDADVNRHALPVQTYPEFAFAVLRSDPTQVIEIKANEPGYHPYGDPMPNERAAREYADTLNERGDVTPAMRAAMEAGSMFGWDTPAADPNGLLASKARPLIEEMKIGDGDVNRRAFPQTEPAPNTTQTREGEANMAEQQQAAQQKKHPTNSIYLTGALEYDPKVISTPNGTDKIGLRLKVVEPGYSFSDAAGNETVVPDKEHYFSCSVVGDKGRDAASQLRAGDQVTVRGKAETYLNKETKRPAIGVTAFDVTTPTKEDLANPNRMQMRGKITEAHVSERRGQSQFSFVEYKVQPFTAPGAKPTVLTVREYTPEASALAAQRQPGAVVALDGKWAIQVFNKQSGEKVETHTIATTPKQVQVLESERGAALQTDATAQAAAQPVNAPEAAAAVAAAAAASQPAPQPVNAKATTPAQVVREREYMQIDGTFIGVKSLQTASGEKEPFAVVTDNDGQPFLFRDTDAFSALTPGEKAHIANGPDGLSVAGENAPLPGEAGVETVQISSDDLSL